MKLSDRLGMPMRTFSNPCAPAKSIPDRVTAETKRNRIMAAQLGRSVRTEADFLCVSFRRMPESKFRECCLALTHWMPAFGGMTDWFVRFFIISGERSGRGVVVFS